MLFIAGILGAYPELIQNGVNGLLIEGDHQDEAARKKAVEAIISLDSNPARLAAIQQQAIRVPWSTSLMAKAWIQHWEHVLSGDEPRKEPCPQCGGPGWRLADGIHCLNCRQYSSIELDQGEPH